LQSGFEDAARWWLKAEVNNEVSEIKI